MPQIFSHTVIHTGMATLDNHNHTHIPQILYHSDTLSEDTQDPWLSQAGHLLLSSRLSLCMSVPLLLYQQGTEARRAYPSSCSVSLSDIEALASCLTLSFVIHDSGSLATAAHLKEECSMVSGQSALSLGFIRGKNQNRMAWRNPGAIGMTECKCRELGHTYLSPQT